MPLRRGERSLSPESPVLFPLSSIPQDLASFFLIPYKPTPEKSCQEPNVGLEHLNLSWLKLLWERCSTRDELRLAVHLPTHADSPRAGSSGLCWVGFWVSPRMEAWQPCWAKLFQCLITLTVKKALCLDIRSWWGVMGGLSCISQRQLNGLRCRSVQSPPSPLWLIQQRGKEGP